MPKSETSYGWCLLIRHVAANFVGTIEALAQRIASLAGGHVDPIEDYASFPVENVRHVQVVGAAETAAEAIASGLVWLAADEGHREVPWLDVFRPERSGFRVMTHTTRTADGTASS